MYRLDYSARQKAEPANYNNDEYLAWQIWLLEGIFQNTLMSIKNANLDFIAASDSYVQEFELAHNKDDVNEGFLYNAKLSTTEICEQEYNILENQVFQDSVFLYKASNSKSLSTYVMRKRAIINPANNQGVGILIVAKKFILGEFRIPFLKQFLGMNKKMKLPNADLNSQQQQIMLCLLYGYHSRKEIAAILSQSSTTAINETRIKNLLSNLYDKFECSTPTQLMQQINLHEIELEIPIDLAKEGNYQI